MFSGLSASRRRIRPELPKQAEKPGQVEEGRRIKKALPTLRRASAAASRLETSTGTFHLSPCRDFPQVRGAFRPDFGVDGRDLASVELTHPSPSLAPDRIFWLRAITVVVRRLRRPGIFSKRREAGRRSQMRLPRDWLCRLQRASVFERGCGS